MLKWFKKLCSNNFTREDLYTAYLDGRLDEIATDSNIDVALHIEEKSRQYAREYTKKKKNMI